jgi:Family of unknown function (DUF5694)
MIAALALTPLAQVLILGTYHFADAGRDGVKTKLRDTLSASRQAEILDLTNRLAQFHPTKIAVEATPERAEELNRHLAGYLGGTVNLTANEIDQLGCRLARLCGVTELTPIDSPLDLDFPRLMQFLGEKDPSRATKLGGQMQSIGRKFEAWDQEFTVSQLLAIHNNPTYFAQSHRFYVSLSDVPPGADILGDWYKRNVRIYGNLRRSIQPGDRVLVIYGSGHAKILRDLVEASGDLTLVEASKYLPRCPVKPDALRFVD